MKIAIGPLTLEHQYGRPYFARGYQLEPTAWVLRAAKGRVTVPSEGPPTARMCAWVHVRPAAVRVTDPLGRRYSLPVSPRWVSLRVVAILLAALAVVEWRRRQGTPRL